MARVAVLSVVIGLGLGVCLGAASSDDLQLDAGAPDPTAVVHELLTGLSMVSRSDPAAVDEAWPLVQQLHFAMGYLLGEGALSETLNRLEASDVPVDRLVAAAFWVQHGQERVPRRLGAPDPEAAYDQLLTFSESDVPLVRCLAVAELTAIVPPDRHSDSSVSPEQRDALAALVALAPSSQASKAALRAIVVGLRADEPVVREALAGETAADPISTLLNEVASDEIWTVFRSSDDPEIRAWLARLGVTLGVAPDATADELSVYETLDSFHVALQNRALDKAFSLYEEVASLHTLEVSDEERLVRGLNSLGMALTRAGYSDRAIAVFDALEERYPDSQLAAFAHEHVRHLARNSS